VKVLVLESEPGAAREVEHRLVVAGHEILRCHVAGLPAFPCLGLSDGRCPLDEPGVDVVVTVRGHVRPSPAPTEDGAVCAIRRGVPVVATGRTVLNPFAPWLEADVAVDDVVDACERAAVSHRG
jgi:hypothetical protein